LLSPGFQPGLPSSSDITLGPIDIARFLLTGVRPSASLLLQQGSSIAPVATVTTGHAEEDSENSKDPAPEEKSIWPNYVIGLHDTFNRGPMEGLENSPGVSRAPEAPARRLTVIDHIFKQRLTAILDASAPGADRGQSRSQPLFKAATAPRVSNSLESKTDRLIGPKSKMPSPKGSPAPLLDAAPVQTSAASTIARAALFLAGFLFSWPRKLQAGKDHARIDHMAAR
jgi:hypothetical protein